THRWRPKPLQREPEPVRPPTEANHDIGNIDAPLSAGTTTPPLRRRGVANEEDTPSPDRPDTPVVVQPRQRRPLPLKTDAHRVASGRSRSRGSRAPDQHGHEDRRDDCSSHTRLDDDHTAQVRRTERNAANEDLPP